MHVNRYIFSRLYNPIAWGRFFGKIGDLYTAFGYWFVWKPAFGAVDSRIMSS